jgi:preprotein translocase subunit Sss1
VKGDAKRLLWFVALWAAGVLAVGVVGFIIRTALRA